MAEHLKTTYPPQWETLRQEYPRHLWALERIPRASPLSQRVTEALSTGEVPYSDLEILWELAHDLEMSSNLDIRVAPPPTGTTLQDTFVIVSKNITYNVHGDSIYRVLLRSSEGWWARLELRPDGALSQELQQNTRSQVTLKGTIQGASSGIASLGGLLRRIQYE